MCGSALFEANLLYYFIVLYDRGATAKASVDLDLLIKTCPDHIPLFRSLLTDAIPQVASLEGDHVDILACLQSLFDFSYGIRCPSDTVQLRAGVSGKTGQLMSAFRAEAALLAKETAQQKYNALHNFLGGHPADATQARLLALAGEVVEMCRAEKPTGSLFCNVIRDQHLSSAQRCDALQLLCENSDRLASTIIWFFKEISANPMHIRGLQHDVDTFVAEHGVECLQAADLDDKLRQMSYFNTCIIEVLRMWPTRANGLSFKILDTLIYDEELICKNADVEIPYYSLFRQLWVDRPDVYMPHRWHESHHQYHALQAAFAIVWPGEGGGAGEEAAPNPFERAELSHLRMLLFHLLYFYDVEVMSLGTPHCIETLVLHGTRIKFVRRN
jgi:hypothetical protein